MNSYYLNNSADLNIYDDEDLTGHRGERSNSADLSDCASSISSDDDTAEREEAVRRMAAMHTAGARYCDGFSIPAPVFDIYAGSDFVRSNDAAMVDGSASSGDVSGGSHSDASAVHHHYLSHHQPSLHAHNHLHLHQETITATSAAFPSDQADPLADSLPLPPLKPRFEYDHDEEHTFIHNTTITSASNNTSNNGGGSGSGGISFSFKKKPVSNCATIQC